VFSTPPACTRALIADVAPGTLARGLGSILEMGLGLAGRVRHLAPRKGLAETVQERI